MQDSIKGKNILNLPDFYKILFDNANDSVLLFRIDSKTKKLKIIEANKTTLKWTGFSKKELLQIPVEKLLTPDSLKKLEKDLKTILKQGFLTHEIDILLKDGRKLPIELSSSLIKYGKKCYVLSSAREIMDRIQTREERKAEIQMKTLLLDILTHDLRNYITILWGFVTEVLYNSKVSLEKMKQLGVGAKSALVKIDSLIDNISVLMRKDVEYNYKLKPICILEVLERTCLELDDMFPKKRIKLDYSKVNPSHLVVADMLFEQLLINILTNSIKNTIADEVLIEVSTKRKANKIILTISDHGKGISPRERKNIFERYKEFREKGIGSGLGLFIIKTLVERYNGKITIESRVKEDYRKGTVFKIELEAAK
ncbi:MAG: PAS domain-containing sensor histidine kinase [Candidatus Heimdallarchaeaceae archaeon]